MTFRVGQKVVCVIPEDDLIRDKVYTVTGVGLGWGRGSERVPIVDVDGSVFNGLAFYAWRFRPIVERKTDISIFTAMLTGTKIPVSSS